MAKKTTTCPVCGTELNIDSKNAATIAHKCNSIPAPGTTGCAVKANERIAALKAAGIDTSNLFAVQSATGEGVIVRIVNGVPMNVPDNDPIFASIFQQGTIPDRRLFRRWVMSQMFRMLTDTRWGSRKEPIGFTEALHNKGYEYQFDMLEEELRIQVKLWKNDAENFTKRNRWFNQAVAYSLVESYIKELKKFVEKLPEKRCKGVPYKTLRGRNIFSVDFNDKVYRPLEFAAWKVKDAKTPQDLYNAFRVFNGKRYKLPWNTKQNAMWVDAYKGSGAYYTLQNLILFHNCFIIDQYRQCLNKYSSMEYLEAAAVKYANGSNGWRLLALLKKTLEDNHVDIAAKQKEWAKKREAKRG